MRARLARIGAALLVAIVAVLAVVAVAYAQAAPANLTLTPGVRSFTASWDAVSGASIYNYWYLSTAPGASLITGNTSATSVTISGLTANQEYRMRVRVSGGSWSQWVSVTALAPPPPGPGSVSLTAYVGAFTATWATLASAVSYDYQYGQVADGGAITWNPAQTTGAAMVTLSALAKDQRYAFRARGTYSGGTKTEWSAVAYVTTLSQGQMIPPTPLPDPTVALTPDTVSDWLGKVELRTTVSYSVDAGEAIPLLIDASYNRWAAFDRVAFVCDLGNGGEHTVIDDAYSGGGVTIAKETSGEQWATSDGPLAIAKRPLAQIISRDVGEASCLGRLYTAAGGLDAAHYDTNAVNLAWRPEGTTLIKKEELFEKTPGGAPTWLFLTPLILGLFVGGATRNAAFTAGAVTLGFGVATWATDANPMTWFLVIMAAAATVLIVVQSGFRKGA